MAGRMHLPEKPIQTAGHRSRRIHTSADPHFTHSWPLIVEQPEYRQNVTSEFIIFKYTYYAAISTDNNYRAPMLKLTAPDNLCLVTEMDVFQMLDTLHPTVTGLDQLPAWFLRLGAPIFAAPLARLFHQSLETGGCAVNWATNQLGDSQPGDKPTGRQPTGRHILVKWATLPD